AGGAGIVPLADVPFATVPGAGATVFPAPRAPFLRAWISARGHVGRALVRDGRLAAWGVSRPCRTGRKIGPLVADDRAAAEATFAALVAAEGPGEVFLDVPSVNRDAVALAQDHGRTHYRLASAHYGGPRKPELRSRQTPDEYPLALRPHRRQCVAAWRRRGDPRARANPKASCDGSEGRGLEFRLPAVTRGCASDRCLRDRADRGYQWRQARVEALWASPHRQRRLRRLYERGYPSHRRYLLERRLSLHRLFDGRPD